MPSPGPGLSPRAEAVTYATDPKRHLSPTPPTPIGDVAGVADRPRNLSLAQPTGPAGPRRSQLPPARYAGSPTSARSKPGSDGHLTDTTTEASSACQVWFTPWNTM